jgi:hypothetical protein
MPPDGAWTLDEVGTGNRVTLTPFDHAFLESPPTYEEGESTATDAHFVARRAPSPERVAAARRLFVLIAGSALLVLFLATLRVLWRALFS